MIVRQHDKKSKSIHIRKGFSHSIGSLCTQKAREEDLNIHLNYEKTSCKTKRLHFTLYGCKLFRGPLHNETQQTVAVIVGVFLSDYVLVARNVRFAMINAFSVSRRVDRHVITRRREAQNDIARITARAKRPSRCYI